MLACIGNHLYNRFRGARVTTHILKEEVGKSQMLYCTYQARYPVEYLSSGNLVSSDGFLHERRNIDSFVLIIVREGTLHITQNEVPFSVGPNQSILLIPDVTHYGHQPSSGPLSYYWTHFYITDPDWRVYNHHALLRYNETARQLFSRQPVPGLNQVSDETIILPEYFHLPPEKRSFILFAQLLDLARRANYQRNWRTHYALNLLLTAFYADYVDYEFSRNDQFPPVIKETIEWIRTHYDTPLSVRNLSEKLGYHPTYLTSLLKKHTGYTIKGLLNYYRIDAAKNLLCTSPSASYSVKRIASICGFVDEKYFMRVFRTLEGMTPSQYRNAFNEKKLVTK